MKGLEGLKHCLILEALFLRDIRYKRLGDWLSVCILAILQKWDRQISLAKIMFVTMWILQITTTWSFTIQYLLSTLYRKVHYSMIKKFLQLTEPGFTNDKIFIMKNPCCKLYLLGIKCKQIFQRIQPGIWAA